LPPSKSGVAVAIEIEPRDVQIAIDRWEAFTGRTVQPINEASRSTDQL
jgi:hypothetical protein